MKAIQPFFILALLCVCSVKTNAFQAIEPLNDTQLSTPRRAIHAFVHWQQQGHKNYENVILPKECRRQQRIKNRIGKAVITCFRRQRATC